MQAPRVPRKACRLWTTGEARSGREVPEHDEHGPHNAIPPGAAAFYGGRKFGRSQDFREAGDEFPPLGPGETIVEQEYLLGDFQRDFHLGSIIDQGQIEATMKDGVLRLVMPKVEQAKPRKTGVKVG